MEDNPVDSPRLKEVTIDGESLEIEDVVLVARWGAKVQIEPSVKSKLHDSRRYVEKAVKRATDSRLSKEERRKWSIYGVTTGFGSLKGIPVRGCREARELQMNLIYSHACGVGDYLNPETVRAIMLLKANTLARGHSGVRYELVQLLVDLLNHNIHPLIPEKGSVGASGDLCLLAHMSLVLIGQGRARIEVLDREKLCWQAIEELDGTGISGGLQRRLKGGSVRIPFELSYKEGLALINGTAAMTAIGVLACYDSLSSLKNADVVGALTLEAIGGRSRAFDVKVHRERPLSGQQASADNIRRVVDGSRLIDKSEEVHDSYSVRCIPQVHGACKDAIDYVWKVLATEINSTTDNPLFFRPDPPPIDGCIEREDYSAGNFHGQPIALAMDLLGLSLSQIGNISERRIQKLLDENHNLGLAPNLAVTPGLCSGFMIPQYTAAALVSENKILCHPASADSIPTSSNNEDHVSMGTIAARKARMILEHVKIIIAIEMMCAVQALDFRTARLHSSESEDVYEKKTEKIGRFLNQRAKDLHNRCSNIPSRAIIENILRATKRIDSISIVAEKDLGSGTGAAHRVIRSSVNPLTHDEPGRLGDDIREIMGLMDRGQILRAVEERVGRFYEKESEDVR